MPAVSEKQRRFMGAELARRRKGLKTKTEMSEQELREFAKKKVKTIKRKLVTKAKRKKHG